MSDTLRKYTAETKAKYPTTGQLLVLSRAALELQAKIDSLLGDCATPEDVLSTMQAEHDVWVASGTVNPVADWVEKVMPGVFDEVVPTPQTGRGWIELTIDKAVVTINTPYLLSEIIRYWDGAGLAGVVTNPYDFGFDFYDDPEGSGFWCPTERTVAA